MREADLPPDAADLMRAAQAGDASAYRRLLAHACAWLKRFYAHRLPPSVVEDAVQDALLAIHEKRHTFDPDRPFGPWLAAIARYKWIDRLRQIANAPVEALDDDVAVGDHEDTVVHATSLARLLGELKPSQQAAIQLVKLQGFSIEEASIRTGQSPSLVKINIHRGLARLASIARKHERGHEDVA